MNTSTPPKKSKAATQAIKQEKRTELIPMKMSKARGFLKGIDTTIEREPDREL